MSKGSAFLGFGTESVIAVKVDNRGRMDIDDLNVKVQQQKDQVGLFVVPAWY